MKFSAKVWKQGNSKIITIPSYFAKWIKKDELINVEIKQEVIMCKCGNIYRIDGKADHKCFYVKFKSEAEAIRAKALIEQFPLKLRKNFKF